MSTSRCSAGRDGSAAEVCPSSCFFCSLPPRQGVAYQQRASALSQRNRALSNYLLSEADRLRGKDVSLAAQLDLFAYRIDPTPEAYTRVVDTQSSVLSTALTGHQGNVDSLSFGAGGKLLATSGPDKSVLFWEISRPGSPRRV